MISPQKHAAIQLVVTWKESLTILGAHRNQCLLTAVFHRRQLASRREESVPGSDEKGDDVQITIRSNSTWCCLFLLCAVSSGARAVDTQVTRADQLRQNGRFQQALLIYRAASTREHTTLEQKAHCLLQIGHCYWGLSRPVDASAAYQEYLASYPNAKPTMRGEAFFHLGLCEGLLQRDDEAIAAFKAAMDAYPPESTLYRGRALDALARRLLAAGNPREALSYLEAARAPSADIGMEAMLHLHRARCHYCLEEFDLAREHFERIAERFPKATPEVLLDARIGIALCQLHAGATAGAVRALAIIEPERKYADIADDVRGTCAAAFRNRTKKETTRHLAAIRAVRDELNGNPVAQLRVHQLLTSILVDLGRYEEALGELQNIVRTAPASHLDLALVALADIANQSSSLRESVRECLVLIMTEHPFSASAIRAHGELAKTFAAATIDERTEKLIAWAQAHEAGTVGPTVLYHVALRQYMDGNSRGALENFRAVATNELATMAQKAGSQLLIGHSHLQMSRFREARTAYQALLTTYPEADVEYRAEALMHMGIADEATGNYDRAIAPLEEAFQLYPEENTKRRGPILASLTSCLLRLERYTEALSHLEAALAGPGGLTSDPQLYAYRARCHYQLNQYEQALRDFRRIVGEFPNAPPEVLLESRIGVASCQLHLGATTDAVKMLTTIEPESAYTERADEIRRASAGAFKNRTREEAARHLEEIRGVLAEMEPGAAVRFRVHRLLANLLLDLGEYDAAQDEIRQLMGRATTDQLASTLDLARVAAEQEPSIARALRSDLARVVTAQAFTPIAYEAFAILVKGTTEDTHDQRLNELLTWSMESASSTHAPLLHYYGALHAFRSGRYEHAVRYAEQHLDAYDDYHDRAHMLMALCFAHTGQHKRARQQIHLLAQDFPASEVVPDALYLHSWILLQERRPIPAGKILERIVRDYPDSDAAKKSAAYLADRTPRK